MDKISNIYSSPFPQPIVAIILSNVKTKKIALPSWMKSCHINMT